MAPNHVFVISLKYSPIHKSHCRSAARSLELPGLAIRYLLSASYRWMFTDSSDSIDYYFPSDSVTAVLASSFLSLATRHRALVELFHTRAPMLLFFNNFHPLNLSVIAAAKRANPDCLIATLVHEPYRADKKVLGSVRGLYASLIEAAIVRQLRQTQVAIVASRNAENLFRMRYRWFRGDLRYVPLLFEDSQCSENLPRRFVSFIGNAVKDKGVDTFFSLVERSATCGQDVDFQIVTRSDIHHYLERLSARARARLTVVNKPRLSDCEISRSIRESVAILALHRDTTQSGVVPMAFMNGTPVIATGLPGLTEFVANGNTGWIIPCEPDVRDVIAAVAEVRGRLDIMSRACRASYEQVFDSANAIRYYAPIWAKFLPCVAASHAAQATERVPAPVGRGEVP